MDSTQNNIIFSFILYYIRTYKYVSTVLYFTAMALNLAKASAESLWTVHAFTDIRTFTYSLNTCVYDRTHLCMTHTAWTRVCMTHTVWTHVCMTHTAWTHLCMTHTAWTCVCMTHTVWTCVCMTHTVWTRVCMTHTVWTRVCIHIYSLYMCVYTYIGSMHMCMYTLCQQHNWYSMVMYTAYPIGQ